MHIEPGYVAATKVVAANAAAVTTVGAFALEALKRPSTFVATAVKTGLAAVFFSLFMQSFHMSVGPSELHFVGAMAMYLTLGFLPTALGFALGLLLQGLLFEPGDLVHLGVNSLSLIVPLVAVHYSVGRKLFERDLGRRLSWRTIVKLDALYYGGLTAMVGFWLLIGEVETPFAAWAAFASSYLVIVVFEPLFTWSVVRLLKKAEDTAFVSRYFVVRDLTLAN
jgi:ABC-type Co2+ transport system permease subunit